MIKAFAAAALAAILLAGCGGEDSSGGGGDSEQSETTDTIRIAEFLYEPDPARVRAGQRVAIVNDDDAPHTVTDKAAPSAFDSGTIKGAARGSVTFSAAGTYSYTCEFHRTMRGTVTVLK